MKREFSDRNEQLAFREFFGAVTSNVIAKGLKNPMQLFVIFAASMEQNHVAVADGCLVERSKVSAGE